MNDASFEMKVTDRFDLAERRGLILVGPVVKGGRPRIGDQCSVLVNGTNTATVTVAGTDLPRPGQTDLGVLVRGDDVPTRAVIEANDVRLIGLIHG